MEIVLLLGMLLSLLLMYFVIRAAVKHALRDARYEEWIEANRPEKAKWAPYRSPQKQTQQP